jgi:hypothetical protein
MIQDTTYSLFEAIADIAYIAGEHHFNSGNSREDNRNFIIWGKEFEKANQGTRWGEDKDYIDTITEYTETKLFGP